MNPAEVLKDPQFLGLPQAEQSKVLFAIDPHFAALPEAEQGKVLSGLVSPSVAPIQTPASPMEDPMAAQVGSVAQFDPNVLPSAEQFKQFGQDVQGVPGQLAKGMVQQLPIAGMVVGGALGAPAGLFGAVGGAGMGGAIGAGARGTIQDAMGWRTPPTLPQALGEMGKEGLMGATAEMAGPILQPIANKIAGPFANYTEKVMAENALAKQGQQMVEQGIPISPDLISPSRTSKAVNWALDNLWPANSIMAGKRREVYDAAVQMKDEFSQQYGLGQTSAALRDRAFQAFSDATGPDTLIPMTKTAEVINDHLTKPFAQIGKPAEFWQGEAKTFADISGEANGQSIRDLSTAVVQGNAKAADSTARKKVMSAINEDLKAYDVENSTNFAEIYAEAGNTSRMWKRIYPIENILKKSMVDSSTELGVSTFSPARFVSQWELQGPRLVSRGAISSQDKSLVDSFADKMRTMIPDINRLGEYQAAGNQMSPGRLLQQAPTGSAYGMGAAVAGQPLLIFPVGAEGAMAYSLMNPNGLLRNFLTTGLKPPTMIPKMGAMKLGENLTK